MLASYTESTSDINGDKYILGHNNIIGYTKLIIGTAQANFHSVRVLLRTFSS